MGIWGHVNHLRNIYKCDMAVLKGKIKENPLRFERYINNKRITRERKGTLKEHDCLC